MNIREYIESGILELYVFGKLTDEEHKEVNEIASQNEEVRDEIIAIEKAVINLSYTVGFDLSADNYEKIRHRLMEKHQAHISAEPRRSNFSQYLGWAASFVLLLALGYQYFRNTEVTEETKTVTAQRDKFEQLLANADAKNAENEKTLATLRDEFSTIVTLEGQAAAPDSYARVYVNTGKNEIYVDLAGLPEPPQGSVYQVWALKLNPLTPASIGVIDDKNANNGILKVQHFDGAEAFGITLEPAGGSATPTLEQLYALGKV